MLDNINHNSSNEPLYKNPNAAVGDRVEDLLSRMTLEEKVAQMMCVPIDFSFEEGNFDIKDTEVFSSEKAKIGIGYVAMPSVGRTPKESAEYSNRIQRIFASNNRLGIPVIFYEEGLHGHDAPEGTNFPTPLGLASTWNPDLLKRITQSIAEEIRVRGSHLVLSPVLDLGRDPRWGRTEETFGEDPYLASRMGVASITGFQGDAAERVDSKHVHATMKHFAAHGNPENGINTVPPNIDEHTLYNIILPPFKAAVEEAKVKAVMPAYNEYNGTPLHSNRKLLTGRNIKRKMGI